jgi:hypothetical protein
MSLLSTIWAFISKFTIVRPVISIVFAGTESRVEVNIDQSSASLEDRTSPCNFMLLEQ